jgi:hypothetical protein
MVVLCAGLLRLLRGSLPVGGAGCIVVATTIFGPLSANGRRGERGGEHAPRADLELLVGVGEVGLDGAQAHEQRLCDLAVAHVLRGQPGDSELCGCQRSGAAQLATARARTGGEELVPGVALEHDRLPWLHLVDFGRGEAVYEMARADPAARSGDPGGHDDLDAGEQAVLRQAVELVRRLAES